jgi:IS5 family transposase
VKLLLLQAWYGLTDEGLEEAVDDRLSFRRFAGIPLDAGVPDHSAIWRFRRKLQEDGRLGAVFEEIGTQLAERGLVVRKGTLIDATLIEAAARRPQPSEGEVSAVDPQASLVRRRDGQTFFGYKAHVAVDEGSGLARAVEVTGADVHDSLVLAALVRGDEGRVTADKGYYTRANRRFLKDLGVGDCILKKQHRFRRLAPWERQLNAIWLARRSAVERVFATLKRPYRLERLRYIGLARNTAALTLAFLAMNLRRALVLLREEAASSPA